MFPCIFGSHYPRTDSAQTVSHLKEGTKHVEPDCMPEWSVSTAARIALQLRWCSTLPQLGQQQAHRFLTACCAMVPGTSIGIDLKQPQQERVGDAALEDMLPVDLSNADFFLDVMAGTVKPGAFFSRVAHCRTKAARHVVCLSVN